MEIMMNMQWNPECGLKIPENLFRISIIMDNVKKYMHRNSHTDITWEEEINKATLWPALEATALMRCLGENVNAKLEFIQMP